MIISLGLPRTGTRSLMAALARLGYTHSGDAFSDERLKCWCSGDLVLDDCDVQDEPAFAFAERIIAENPDARFIVTKRDFESWFRSCGVLASPKRLGRARFVRYEYARRLQASGQELTHTLSWLLDIVAGGWRHDERLHEAVWREHYGTLKAKLDERALFIDVCGGEGWGPLCEFLGRMEPEVDFPWEGRSRR